ncbi:TIGR02300 family protein [Telmatospirillum siberiense]|uniref:TIGR02300 family protein n=1 Tax=Telmatospirillum siberiense TaxID=382514 RepID=A0A2N3PSN5_9PROT|nr:TIGR02300 family protein [Telmatospirillum siberiense]PKU23417.1 TIGR02300 family protein [Telmatospirillum siberiense]
MAKPEWGAKRTCQSCSARFYDMARSPIICPKCGATVEPEVTFKARRQSAPVAEAKAPAVVRDVKKVDLDEAGEELEVIEEEEGTVAAGEEAEEDESLIEDASDLGEDDDDMAEVMEHIDEDLDHEL